MDIGLSPRKRGGTRVASVLAWPQSTRNLYCVGLLALLLALGTLVVYKTGGTAYAYPYLLLVPVLFASAWYGLMGGLGLALLASGLLAFVPLDVEQGVMQGPANWLPRMGLYLMLGGVAGALFQSLRHSYREREVLVRTDTCSGLPNQAALTQDLSALRERHRYRSEPMGSIIVRLSDITDVLEAMGADASDELMAQMGRRLQCLVEGEGKVYRVGVSELIILMPGVDEARLKDIARHIIDAGEDNLIVQTEPVRVQLVLGSTLSFQVCQSTEGLIGEARVALSKAIRRRMNHCHYSPGMATTKLSNISLISSVRLGLERGEFELHYQPQVCLDDGAVRGCEALIRWRDAQGRLILPGQFMPKVEETTLIEPVTRFVSREACEFLTIYKHSVSINFSARNLVDEKMLAFLHEQVESLGIKPQSVEVEVTESALIQNLDSARAAIERLRTMGFDVSIDDFGTGFASFEYLQHLPITGIKIDRAFVSGVDESEKARRLIACMIEMGHALDLTVTAEGVETAGQCRVLQSLACDRAQGYYFARPMAAGAFMEWSEQYRPSTV